MNIVKEFNGLNGEMVSRDRLKKMAENAVYQEQKALAERLKRAAKGLDDDEEVKVNINRRAFEEIPDYILKNLPFDVPKDEDYNGLAKAVSPDEIYQYITDLMVNTIKKVGHLPWQMEWEKTAMYNGHQAINYDSKKGYRGINFFLTNFIVEIQDGKEVAVPRDLSNPYFLTFNQIKKHGGTLTKGSKGVRVVYFTRLWFFEGVNNKGENIEFGSYDQKRLRAWLMKNRGNFPALKDNKAVERWGNNYIPILKYYNIFHGADVQGIEWGLIPKNENVDKPEHERIDIAEAIVKAMPNPPKIEYKGDQPVYKPRYDMVQMTPIEAFSNEQSYYSTLFHELVHSTGHKKRLDRFKNYSSSKKDYAFEELVAEMGAVFLCSESGILFFVIDNSAKYLSGWNSRLVERMEDDNRFFFRACSRSQAAADYMLDRDKDGNAAYIKKIVSSSVKQKKETNKSESKKTVSASKLLANGTLSKTAKTAIKEVAAFKKFKEITTAQAEILYKYFKNTKEEYFEDDFAPMAEIFSKKEAAKFKVESHYYEFNATNFKIDNITPVDGKDIYGDLLLFLPGLDLIKSINNRIESVQNKANNYSLFSGLKGPIPFFSKKSEAKKFVIEWAKKHLKDKKYFHPELKKEVVFSMSGIRHTAGNKLSIPKAVLITQAEEMLKRSHQFGDFQLDKDGRKHIKGVYRMISYGELLGVRQDVIITLREGQNGVVYYDHKIEEIKKLPSASVGDIPTVRASKEVSQKSSLPKESPKLSTSTKKTLNKDKQKPNTTKKSPKNGKKGLKNPVPAPETAPSAEKMPEGFTMASEGTKKEANTFRLNGELGKLLGDLQRFRLAIVLQGDAHAGKSEMCAQLANGFLDIGLNGGYFDLEQGGLTSKDTQAAFKRNITPENQKRLATTGEAPEGIETIRKNAEKFDFVVIDSFQELDEPTTAFNDLRKDYPNTIWIIIFQQNAKGAIRGGSRPIFDAPLRLKVHCVDDTFVNNYAEVEKNRGNRIGVQYNVSQKKVINDTEDPDPDPEIKRPAESSTGRLIIYE